MKTPVAALAGLALLGACSAPVPNDVREGVGFGDYATYAQPRSVQPQAPILPPASSPTATAPDTLAARAAAAIDAAEGGAQTTPAPNAPGISDEQDFNAVAARESIESDAERREGMQDQLVIVQPTAIPDRPAATGANVVDYALSTSHPVGEQRYSRSPFRQGRHQANCLAYRSDDLAQEAFLLAGGPERDRQALDPDGDGYACGWDPAVYRNAARAARGT